MKRVLLIFGSPNHGKSHLAKKLMEEHGFHHVSVDEAYVEFIQTKCSELFFPKLGMFIAQHFGAILNPPAYTKQILNRDYVSEWHAHLMTLVAEMSAHHDKLAVEGYLLEHCLEGLEGQVKTVARVFTIQVKSRTYRVLDEPLSIEGIAALGLEVDGE